MTTIHVDATGASGAEKTITAAIGKAAPGDEIIVRDGVYRESVAVNKRLTIRAEDGHKPEVDGGYGPHLFGDASYTGFDGKPIAAGKLPAPTAANVAKGNWFPKAAPSNVWSPLFNVTADDVTIEGLVIRNSAGRGGQTTANRTVFRNCVIDFCYTGCVFVDGVTKKLAGIVIEDCTITRGSIRAFDPTRPGAGGATMAVDSCLIIRNAAAPEIRGNTVAYCYGEGLWLGNGTTGAKVHGNVLHTCLHDPLYVNGGGTAAEIIGNRVFSCDNLKAEMSKAAPLVPYGNVTLADEELLYQSGPGLVMYDNIFVGGLAAPTFWIDSWNGAGNYPRPYQLNQAYIGFNTFVGGQFNDFVISFGSRADKPHANSLFENNIILAYPGKAIATATTHGGGYSGVIFRNNLSNKALPAQQVGTASVVTAAPVLADPFAPITGTFAVDDEGLPDVATTFDPANYAPLGDGPAWDMASDGGPVNGVTPPIGGNVIGAWVEVDEPDPDPGPDPEPPPAPWWANMTDDEWRELLPVLISKLATILASEV
jgi:hypothetical protein